MGMAGQLGQFSPHNFVMQMCQNYMAACQAGQDPFNVQIFKNPKKQKAIEQPPDSQSIQEDGTPKREVLALENGKHLPVKGSPSEGQKDKSTKDHNVKNKENEVKPESEANLFDLEMVQPPDNQKAKDNAKAMAAACERREENKQHAEVPPLHGKAKAKAQAKAKALAKVKADKGSTKESTTKVSEAKTKKPSPPKAGEGTVFYKSGKIHRNDRSSCWRVFINKSDRNDKKVYWKGSEADSFKRALALIDAGK